MKSDDPIPDLARKTLARLGAGVEYTERESGGVVDLAKTEVANEDLEHLVFFPGFAALDLDHTSISDGGLSHIGQMQSLESVRLSDTLVSDVGIWDLRGLTKLERLDIGCYPGCLRAGQRPVPPDRVRRNYFTNAALEPLGEIFSLRSLSLHATHVDDVGLIDHLPELSKLQGLSLAYLRITDRALAALQSVAWLERINLKHTGVSCDSIVDLANDKAHTLRRFNLSNTQINDAALAEFPEQSQLLELTLKDTGITDLGCEYIARNQWLETLRLDQTEVTDVGVRALVDCEHLQTLQLYKTKATDTSLVWLSDSKLEHLGLGCTSISDAGMPDLAEYRELRSLDLSGTPLTDRGMRFLSEARSLEQLYLERTQITDAGLCHLRQLPLESLSLDGRISDAALKELSEQKYLLRLAIAHSQVSNWRNLAEFEKLEVLLIDDSVEDLSPLESLKQLKLLMLWGDQFSATQLARLRLALPNCQMKRYEPFERADCDFRKLCRYG